MYNPCEKCKQKDTLNGCTNCKIHIDFNEEFKKFLELLDEVNCLTEENEILKQKLQSYIDMEQDFCLQLLDFNETVH